MSWRSFRNMVLSGNNYIGLNKSLYGTGSLTQESPEFLKYSNSQIIHNKYSLTDFGENAINNHFNDAAWHSEKCQTIFNYVTRNFRERCNSIQTYNDDDPTQQLIIKQNVLKYASKVNADIIFTPYVGASVWMDYEYYDYVLPVGSHYDNNGQCGLITNRHDITLSPEIILPNSIAVGARRDTPEEFKGSTSFGNGMEFFVDISIHGLLQYFPDKDIPKALAEILIDSTGYIVSSDVHKDFTKYIQVGDEVTIRNGNNYEICLVESILGPNSFVSDTKLTSIYVPGKYAWINVTLPVFCGAQQQSWAIPIVAGQLKVIKMSTNSNWDTVRNAARLTAIRNTTNIPEIDESNWDIYRGFGQIDVDAAIDYINNN